MIVDRARVGKVLRLERVPVEPDPMIEYTSIGIRSFGKGIFHYEPKLGAQLGSLRFFEVKPDRLVVSNIKGWEGAIAVSSTADAGHLASNRLLSYVPVDHRIDVRWARWYFLSEPGLELIQRASPGSADRNRTLAIERFEALEIPLPPIDEQRRQADRLDAVDGMTRGAAEQVGRIGAYEFASLLSGLIDSVVARTSVGKVVIGEAADFVSDTIHPGEDPSPATSFVGLQHIESHTGRRIGSDSLGQMKGTKFRFQPGDVLYGYLRPYLNKVWLADRHGLCSVDQYVLRPRAGVDGALLAYCLRGRRVLTQAIDLTHSLQLPRLRSGLLAALEVPVVAKADVQLVVGHVDSLRDRIVRATANRQHQEDLLGAVLPSALNEAFGLS